MTALWNNLNVSIQHSDDIYGNGVENVLGAVDRFSRKQKLRRFNDVTDATLSISEMIEQELYTDFDFWGVVHPEKSVKELMLKSDISGEFVEGQIKVHYNPFHRKNVITDNKGMFLIIGGSAEHPTYSDLLFYDNKWWKTFVDNLYQVQDESSKNCGELRMAMLSLVSQDSESLGGFMPEVTNFDTEFN